ncbi:nucleoside diphosphate kinase regulator [Rhodopseudomonas palustris]|jgi:regulator of nucleoside diphosphate kinase|uniref:Nucleoside diphosphate kinase regulator n=1 Tax=Rhodopseudomonas palustris TaxID=1076 RepID=A0AAX3E1G0_RHOPL|nr:MULTISPECIES: nucleoside diphosphate kinase regulator [Rhodopseudomonas]AVT79757.1 nucleoside-diphosphate kinase [Rhodopseudomonas palustris]NEV77987.1 nucleoside diphosphate kinase regulator [Rhodopseudomonas sp. BR0C11]NEW95587.1 nucleoside diphosphate kinase regulator [Rhodopseudomonas sp. BR0G17]UYO40582.1 nucleoside diphosphate kinase regulator [Rhodopseudomonas palustris]UYO45283.1 nucleoside diphosphate kinase regulator [Rhodopseudomonas palustris]
MIQSIRTQRPPITIRNRDAERLGQLAEAAAQRYPATADFLAGEVARANVAPDHDPLPGIVCMESALTFRDDTTGKEKQVTLVYPTEADVEAGRISVLTPIGAALIGLSVGQSISFETPSGERRSLTVLSVSEPN